ncbi:hypothetical protein C7S16_4954 [Burkholderia thailandensis]|uniref:Uncharacterized protein n=1 Tax=Burkholderia thailandensis TaxID=57975 RepID=A0AAW9CMJ6_BURTH|nr:hypothetical protein [Burkholderia thailandensis]
MRDITPSSLFATEAAVRICVRISSIAAPERAAPVDARGRIEAWASANANADGGAICV